jgi:hypothetical protein
MEWIMFQCEEHIPTDIHLWHFYICPQVAISNIANLLTISKNSHGQLHHHNGSLHYCNVNGINFCSET